jgi:hypothetical protein
MPFVDSLVVSLRPGLRFYDSLERRTRRPGLDDDIVALSPDDPFYCSVTTAFTTGITWILRFRGGARVLVQEHREDLRQSI